MSEDKLSSATVEPTKGAESIEVLGVLAEARRMLGVYSEAQLRELGHHLNLPAWQTDNIVTAIKETPASTPDHRED